MTRVLALAIALLSVTDSSAEEEHELWAGTYTLSATFDKADEKKNFFHDVDVRLKSTRFTVVIHREVPQDSGASDEEEVSATPPIKTAGFGGGENPEWRRRPPGQTPWLPFRRKLYGETDSKGNIRFGFTTVRDCKLISLHFVGRPSEKGATGKAYRISKDEPTVAGTWELHSPNPQALPAGPTLKGVSRGR